MYILLCVYIYTYIYIVLCVHTHTFSDVCIHAYSSVNIHSILCIHIYICILTSVYIYIHIVTRTHTCCYAYTYIYIVSCTYTYIVSCIYIYIVSCIYILLCVHLYDVLLCVRIYIHSTPAQDIWLSRKTQSIPHCCHTYCIYIYCYVSTHIAARKTQAQIIGLFCRISSVLCGSFAKETYKFKKHTNRSHSIVNALHAEHCV